MRTDKYLHVLYKGKKVGTLALTSGRKAAMEKTRCMDIMNEVETYVHEDLKEYIEL